MYPLTYVEIIPFSEFYFQHSMLIDSLLAFLLFWVAANHSLKRSHPESRGLSFVFAVALAIGVALLEDRTGYSLANFSVIAIYVLILVLLILIGRLFWKGSHAQNAVYFNR